MTKEEILEGNKLIAQFLGLTIITDEISLFDTNYKPLAKYHESWNDLMPVVEKIESTRDYYVKIYGNQAYVQCKVMADTTILTSQKYVAGSAYTEENTKLSNTWSAIVEFIKWYNEKCSE